MVVFTVVSTYTRPYTYSYKNQSKQKKIRLSMQEPENIEQIHTRYFDSRIKRKL